MGKLSIDLLQSGMVLQDEVRGMKGKRLFPAGVELDEQKITILKAWGVVEADIIGGAREISRQTQLENGPVTDEAQRLAKRYVTQAFRGQEVGSSFMRQFKLQCMKRTAKAIRNQSFSVMSAETMRDLYDQAAKSSLRPGMVTPQNVVEKQLELISFPDIYYEIVRELEFPFTTSRRLAGIVSKDTGLAARILKLVNSPFYGFPSRIESIERALTILGSNELTTLTLGLSVVHSFLGVPETVFNVKDFWEYAISCGILSRLLGAQCTDLMEERLFVGGLLQPVGMLLMISYDPASMCKAVLLSRKKGVSLPVAERAVFGFNHAEVGATLLESWNIPETLTNIVRHCYTPLSSPLPIDSSIVHLATIMATGLRSKDFCTYHLPDFFQATVDETKISPSALVPILSQYDRQLADTHEILTDGM
ncbi:HDOD domain-containing protein [Halodesulfovibrio aestuarii]|uniref:HDOD domain-containing protein n=1 Tax=Halodesulfovibrio aestuarii TaxID=126333 RepID=UPI0004023F3E